jgi:DNA-directed RNA polymerase subunit N (RpoN/RPB10)
LRLLISDRVFKIGNSIKADFTRLKKQFSQLKKQKSFNVIDLKEYCTRRGIIPRKGSGGLDILLEKTAGTYLSKDESLRKSNDWEGQEIRPDLLQYAALDVYASRIVFEKATEIAPPANVDADTTSGTRIVLLLQEGGAPVAYGKVADTQPTSLGRVRVKVPTKSRLVVDIDRLLTPSASAILHLLPGEKHGKAKAGTFTLGQLRDMSGSHIFQVVASVSHLRLDTESNMCLPVRDLEFYVLPYFYLILSHF